MNQIDNIMKLVNDMADEKVIRAAIEAALGSGEPVYQIWKSSDSCGEFYSWEDVDADEFVTSKAHESAKRTLYTAPQPQPNDFNPDWDTVKAFDDRYNEDTTLIKQALHALERADKISGYANNKKVVKALRERLK